MFTLYFQKYRITGALFSRETPAFKNLIQMFLRKAEVLNCKLSSILLHVIENMQAN